MNGIHQEIVSFLYNFVADYILLFLVKKDLFPEIRLKQQIKGAVAFAVTYILWDSLAEGLPPYLKVFSKWLLIFILLCIFFKIRSVKLLIKTVIVFLLYMFLLAGSVSFFLSCINIESVNGEKEAYKAMGIMLSGALLLYLWKQKKRRECEKKALQSDIYEIQLLRKGKKAAGEAIYDSGNLLTSEITGQGVCIIPERLAKKLLLPEEWEKVKEIYKTDDTKGEDIFSWKAWAKLLQSGIYVLRYSTVGVGKAAMPAVMAEEIVVLKNKEVLVKTKGMLGISQEELSEKNQFSVLLPADIFDRENNRSII